jgi:O-antigen ligase
VLWLWLKMGLAGLAAFLAVVALALSRALRVVRSTSMVRPEAALAIVTAATLLMYLAFATVDLALIGTRGSIPLAVALAVAFALPRPEQAEAKEGP